MRIPIVILAFLVLAGCATPYQQIGDVGGYYHQRLSENVFRVSFSGNGFTKYKRAYDFALLRAAEIGAQLGFSHFAVEGQADRSSSTVVDMGSTSYTTGSVSGYGSYYGTTNTYSNSISVFKPGVELVILYFEGRPSAKYLEVYESKTVVNQLKAKYGLTSP